MSEKKYKILKNFTPRDLYEAHAPIELFLKQMEFSGNYVDAMYVPMEFFKQGIEIHSNKFWVIMLFGGKYYFISKMGKTEILAEKFPQAEKSAPV